MGVFLVFSIIAMFGLIGYGVQILAVRAYLRARLQLSDYTDRERTGEVLDLSGSSETSAGQTGMMPSVSILKPLKGLDDNLFDNLASFCHQNYPKYEIILSLQDQNDPAFRIAQKIRDRYPQTDIRLVVEKCCYGLNPKVNNLIPAYRASEYEYVVISDSNVMVDKGYLRQIMAHMRDPQVGLVSNLIRGAGGRSLGAILENLHLNSFVLGSVCLMHRFLKMPCVIGKSMLIRKKTFEDMGGFHVVKDILAEDYVIGREIHRMGKRVVLSDYIITNLNEYWSMKRFLNRHSRWGKLRWKIGGMRYFTELLGNAVFISYIPVLLCEPVGLMVCFAAMVSLLKGLGDYYLGKKLGAEERGFYYILSPIKDLLMGGIWFIPLFNNRIVWRGNVYKIGRGSVLDAGSRAPSLEGLLTDASNHDTKQTATT